MHPSPPCRLAWTLLLAVCLVLAAAEPRSALAGESAPVRGVNVYYQGHDATDPAAIASLLDSLSIIHVDTILLTFPIFIDGVTGSAISRIPEGTGIHEYADTPTDAEIQAFIDPARKRGFTVWIRPLLDEGVLVDAGTWRGELAPANPATFFANYTLVLTGLVGGLTGADWLVIGTELTSLQQIAYEPYWATLIASVRTAPGAGNLQLTYASNWDSGGYPATPAWFGLLDAISIDAWFPATGLADDATSADITGSLTQWTATLAEFTTAVPGLPLFITELGVASQAMQPSVLQQPWQWPRADLPPAPDVQARFAEGSCRFYTQVTGDLDMPLVQGIFWWVTSVSQPEDPLTDRSFEFLGKPAATAIAACFDSWAA